MIGSNLPERLLTTEQVSKWLGIAQRTVCTWAECNEIPALKVGRQWRFRRQELIIWLQRSKVPGHRANNKPLAATAAEGAYTSHKSRL
jgi:excisionase family DNA binding protein